MRTFSRIGMGLLVGSFAASTVLAGAVTVSATDGFREASAHFEVSGGDLFVTLSNTTLNDVGVPIDVLIGVFFDLSSNATLTPISAVLNAGSSVLFGVPGPGGDVGGEWAYRGGFAGPDNTEYGISSAGLGIFGPGNRFNANNLQGPADPDGLQYGIVSAGDNPATGNTPVTGTNALIKNAVVFRFDAPANFDPMAEVGNVWFQYGTDLSEPRIPEPASLSLLALGGLALLRRR